MTNKADDTVETQTPTGFAAILAKAVKLKLVRVMLHFASERGPLMGSGLAFQALFAVFSALWVGFSIVGFVIQGDIGLRTSLIETLAQAVPGLIDSGDGSGAVDASVLLEAGALTWSAAFALVILFATALNWLASAREAVRAIFELPGPTTNLLLLKLRDLGVAIVLGAALIISVVLSSVSTNLLGAVLDFTGIGSESLVATVLGRIVGLAVALTLDTFVLVALYRLLSGVHIPFPRLVFGSLLGGVALGALKALGGLLLGGASNNPLIASFAVIAGLLIFFNLVCQVILISAAWIAIGMKDDGIPADPKAEAARLEQERLAREAAEARRPRRLAQLFQRLRGRARGGQKASAPK
ncbi:MAG TPA: YihY/virulence factor BrkB family protein [Marisediminicola sp.]|jgi:membrane protein|nr:YihY/virulence factor BrkB family protein [Marisediminicola sp.]